MTSHGSRRNEGVALDGNGSFGTSARVFNVEPYTELLVMTPPQGREVQMEAMAGGAAN